MNRIEYDIFVYLFLKNEITMAQVLIVVVVFVQDFLYNFSKKKNVYSEILSDFVCAKSAVDLTNKSLKPVQVFFSNNFTLLYIRNYKAFSEIILTCIFA